MHTPKQTVLIVDDSPANIEILSDTLGTEHEILFATSGEEALEIARNEAPDLILLDVVMPDMDGYDVCLRLKSDPRTEEIPVIFVTAMDQEEDEAKGLNIGGIDYLTKPIRPPIVRARVRNHLELKRHRDFLMNLSAVDGLTGLANSRCFKDFLGREWRRAVRNRTSLSLILMDIDLFKAFNDRYGYLAGDDCLRHLAAIVAGSVRRPADLAARYGSEEFACLLPDTDLNGALFVANQIHTKIERAHIPHAGSTVADHVTLSMGVASVIPVVGQPTADLVRRAEELLFAAKQSGRNQIRS